MTRISVALATFNGADFLPQQLESYCGQERRPDELVVGDDGSSDDSLAILREFAAKAPFPVRLIEGSAGGITANFERVINACTGDLVLLSDQDDIWLPSKIVTIERSLAAAPDKLALHHDEWLMDSDSGERFDKTFNQRARTSGNWEHVLYVGNCSAFRKELVPILLPIPAGLGFDYWLSIIPEMLGTRLILDEPLQYWRRHRTNSSQPTMAEVHAPSPWTMAQRFAGQDPRSGWASERETLQLIAHRIEEKADAIDALIGPGRARKTVEAISKRMSAIDGRSKRLSVPRSRRWIAIASAWSRGEYSYFSGWRSALKDAIRRG